MKELVAHRANFLFHFRNVDHDDCVPRASVQESSLGTLAEAFLAADAEDGVDLDAAERWMIIIRNPEHAIFDRTILYAGGRPRAAGAALGDDGKFFRLLLAGSGQALRAWLVL